MYLQLFLVCCCEVAFRGFCLHRVVRVRLEHRLLGLVESKVLICLVVRCFKIEARLAVRSDWKVLAAALYTHCLATQVRDLVRHVRLFVARVAAEW